MRKSIADMSICLGKKTFAQEDEALGFAKLMTKKFPDNPSRVYYCHVCQRFHITTKRSKSSK